MKIPGSARRRSSWRERRRRAAINAGCWVFVLCLTWWLSRQDYHAALRSPVPARATATSLPELAFMPVGAGAGEGDARRILSPAVFALPGASGFSAPLERESVISPPPEPASDPVSYVLNGASFTPTTYGETKVSLDDLIDQPRGLGRPKVEPLGDALSAVPNNQSPSLSFIWLEDHGDTLPMFEAPVLPGATSEAPWQAIANVCFNDEGFASQVLLERPSPEPAVNDALARALRGIFYDAPPGESCRRLIIRFEPVINTAASP